MEDLAAITSKLTRPQKRALKAVVRAYKKNPRYRSYEIADLGINAVATKNMIAAVKDDLKARGWYIAYLPSWYKHKAWRYDEDWGQHPAEVVFIRIEQ